MGKLFFFKGPLIMNAIHYLKIVRFGMEYVRDEVYEPSGGSAMAYLDKCIYRHGSIAQPAITVVPVAHISYNLGYAGSYGGQNGTSGVVGHEFEYQHAPLYIVVEEGIFFGTVGPVHPIEFGS